MYKHVLIATDGSELAQKAEMTGLTVARAFNAQATAVTVTEPWDALSMAALAERGMPDAVFDYDERMRALANKVLWRVSETAKSLGTPCLTIHVKDRRPAEGIIEYAKTHPCDLIVISSHGRSGITSVLLGSQAIKVLMLSHVPVLVCR
ncbi:MAG TPA: universal stress protein [Hyphomicrobiaceae bacterium]|jgi:nucleotide-binding universal stress UspA family protein|nr:universal stress protein [Hyphomicrobiaceae bacterium]